MIACYYPLDHLRYHPLRYGTLKYECSGGTKNSFEHFFKQYQRDILIEKKFSRYQREFLKMPDNRGSKSEK